MNALDARVTKLEHRLPAVCPACGVSGDRSVSSVHRFALRDGESLEKATCRVLGCGLHYVDLHACIVCERPPFILVDRYPRAPSTEHAHSDRPPAAVTATVTAPPPRRAVVPESSRTLGERRTQWLEAAWHGTLPRQAQRPHAIHSPYQRGGY